MELLLPRKELECSIAAYYSKSLRGRKPYPLSGMLRIHCLQLFYNLSDPAMEDTLYEVQSMRQFAGITIDTVPDETTILNFRPLLEEHNLGKKLFEKINKHLAKKGLNSKKAPSWMPVLSKHRPQRKIKTKSAILKCIKPKKVINGTSA